MTQSERDVFSPGKDAPTVGGEVGLVRQLDADAASAHGDGLTGPGPSILSETGSGAAGGRHTGGAAPVLPRCRGALSLRPSVPPSLVLRYN